jgi:hypothetical protein
MLVDTNKIIIKTYIIKNNNTIGEIFFNKFFAQRYNLIITKLD